MNVPLERLYSYLGSLTDDDIIIYHWYPHGSKKLDDLTHFFNKNTKFSYFASVTTPHIFFHDQEPLDYQLYSTNDFKNFISQHRDHYKRWSGSPGLLDDVVQTHLRCCTLSPTNFYEKTLICHSEKNSQDLTQYENNNFLGVYYWNHAVTARDWFRFAEHDTALDTKFYNVNYDFLIYNRAWSGTREYRLKFCELLAQANLIPNCNIKFSAVDTDQHYSQHTFKNSKLAITQTNLDTLFDNNSHDASASADYNSADYATAAIEVVLETIFDDTKHHLTEKTLRAIACKKPFIIVSTPGILSYLRSYGFRTFDGLIDESYDLIQDPVERLQAVTKEMVRISSMTPGEKQDLYSKLHAIAVLNHQRFFSNDFFRCVIGEFKSNLQSALYQCKTTLSRSWYDIAATIVPLSPQHDRAMTWFRENSTSMSKF